MELQLHPASGRGAVRTFAIAARGERAVLILLGGSALLAVSLWVTVPTAVMRSLRSETSDLLAAETAAARRDRGDLDARAAGLRDRARDAAGLVSRIAFLYSVPPAGWPRGLSPEAGRLASADPEAIAGGLSLTLEDLERGRALLEGREAAEPGLAASTPSRLPLDSGLVEPAALFGPRTSPWTGAEEFFTGLDLAAPAGAAVVAPASGRVAFAGRVPASRRSRFWRFGNVVVLRHGTTATFYGHMGRVDVRRGQRVRRGDVLGVVGATGWAFSPMLHYELWRPIGASLEPTDPRFAILDRRLGLSDVSLERMEATRAPERPAPPPGL